MSYFEKKWEWSHELVANYECLSLEQLHRHLRSKNKILHEHLLLDGNTAVRLSQSQPLARMLEQFAF